MKKRDQFTGKWGFIVACIGSAVGMGNIWLFPARVSQYGGAAFLIPYFICVVVIGYTGVIGEMAFGRAMEAGPLVAFGKVTERSGRGRRLGEMLALIPVLGSLALAIGYSVVVGWILKYAAGSITGSALTPVSVGEFEAAFGATASSFGSVGWQLAGLAVVFAIMVFGVSSGIERANRVMMPLFFLMFIAVAVYVSTLDGAGAGYRYLFLPESWSALLNPKTWLYALGQAFFSLSLAGSGTLVYGSYLKKDADIPFCARNVALFDTLAALIAALAIIPAMAVAGVDTTQSGPGLMFIYLPGVFKQMPGGRIVMIVFFVAVLFAGLSSLINLFESPIEALQTRFGFSRRRAVGTVGAVGAVVGVCIEGIVSGWMDVCSIYLCPVGALLAGILFFWVCGKDFVRAQIDQGAARPLGKAFEPMSKYGFCGLTLLVLVLGSVFGGIG
ncbi:sodium-dependent transporter [Oscillibacter sp. MSJ-2]|uniref:Sodium-dependent transporter n=1 Tax=Dysosmobacter acutus TaxID=2841504 RepID=A0ABS6FB52_9FIRM|nr:sodium-dependent transporter [Dysosmobacter acutus]MBU5626590.1 sodium-dependent transporter [Dysosmobacter acutus]